MDIPKHSYVRWTYHIESVSNPIRGLAYDYRTCWISWKVVGPGLCQILVGEWVWQGGGQDTHREFWERELPQKMFLNSCITGNSTEKKV